MRILTVLPPTPSCCFLLLILILIIFVCPPSVFPWDHPSSWSLVCTSWRSSFLQDEQVLPCPLPSGLGLERSDPHHHSPTALQRRETAVLSRVFLRRQPAETYQRITGEHLKSSAWTTSRLSG